MRASSFGNRCRVLSMCAAMLNLAAGVHAETAPKQLNRSQCICLAVCATLANPNRILVTTVNGCSRLRDELIYDNLARCACPQGPTGAQQPARERQSPNH